MIKAIAKTVLIAAVCSYGTMLGFQLADMTCEFIRTKTEKAKSKS